MAFLSAAAVSFLLFQCAQSSYILSTFAGGGISAAADGVGTNVKFDTRSGTLSLSSMINNTFLVQDFARLFKVESSGLVTALCSSCWAGLSASSSIAALSTTRVFIKGERSIILSTNGGASANTFAGVAGGTGNYDGVGAGARFDAINFLTMDPGGNLYVSQCGTTTTSTHSVRRVSPDTVVKTLAGQGTAGFLNAIGTSALFNCPSGLSKGADSDLFVAEFNNYCVRSISPTGVVKTFAGLCGSQSYVDGAASSARFSNIQGISMDSQLNLFISDHGNNRIRKVTPIGRVSTLAGSGLRGFSNGIALKSMLEYPSSITATEGGTVFFSDSSDLIRVLVDTQPGFFYIDGMSTATPCPGGTYNPVNGSTSRSACLSCGSNTFSPIGSSFCTLCPNGTSSLPASPNCTTCSTVSLFACGKEKLYFTH